MTAEPIGATVSVILRGAWRRRPAPVPDNQQQLAACVSPLLAGGCGALAWRALREVDGLPATLLGPLEQARCVHALGAAVHRVAVARLFTALSSNGIDAILAKGWAAAQLYAEPALRPHGDIDIFVARGQRALAASVARELGDLGVAVDVQTELAELSDRSFDELCARAHVAMIDGTHVPILDDEHHLRFLCLHALRHGVSRPVWLCDIGAAIEAVHDGFDWDLSFRGSLRQASLMRVALDLAHRLLDASLPAASLGIRGAAPIWAERSVIQLWGRSWSRDANVPLVRIARRRPQQLAASLCARWPSALQATVRLQGPLDTGGRRSRGGRLSRQIVLFALRLAAGARRQILAAIDDAFLRIVRSTAAIRRGRPHAIGLVCAAAARPAARR